MVIASFDVPEELVRALSKGNFSLLIKGLAGTGKTTLALELVRKMGDTGTGYYVSTRVSSKKLFKQFPWFKENIPEENILDARKPQIPTAMPKYVLFEYTDEPDFLRALYAKIESSKKQPTTIVIDSLDALKTNLDIPMEDLRIEKALLEIGEASNSNIIFIVERSEYLSMDYLVDGVVTLTREIINGRLVRKMVLEKIRGEEIKKPTFIFTLKDGRFRHFREIPALFPREVTEPPLITSGNRISTGIEELNNLVAGGFERGSFNLLKVGKEVGLYYSWILRPFVASLVQHKIPVMILPCEGEPTEEIQRWIAPFVGEENFSTYVRIAEFREVEKSEPYIIRISGKNIDEDYQLILNEARRLMEMTGSRQVAVIVGVDTLEYHYGVHDAHKMLVLTSVYSKTGNLLVMAVAKYGQELIKVLNHMATTHFKLENIEGTVVMYGFIPRTEMYAVTVTTEKGYIETHLVPIE